MFCTSPPFGGFPAKEANISLRTCYVKGCNLLLYICEKRGILAPMLHRSKTTVTIDTLKRIRMKKIQFKAHFKPKIESKKRTRAQLEEADNTPSDQPSSPILNQQTISSQNPKCRSTTIDWSSSQRIFIVTPTLRLLFMKKNERLCVYGRVAVRVLRGAVSVNGFILTPYTVPAHNLTRWWTLYSPYNHCAVVFDTGDSLLPFLGDSLQQTRTASLPTETTTSDDDEDALLLQAVTAGDSTADTVLALRSLSENYNNERRVVTSEGTSVASLFFTLSRRKRLHRPPHFRNLSNMFNLPQLRVVTRGDYAMEISAEWEALRQQCVRSVENVSQGPPTILLCGRKGVGKSTLSRYLLNSLLNVTPAVAYLETDIGQSEFTPPGLVSLTIVSSPLFGPPFTHITSPWDAYFVGDVTPKESTTLYLRAVLRLYSEYLQMNERLPLVINTHGWVKGEGFRLLLTLLTHIRPHYVVQLDTPSTENCERKPLLQTEVIQQLIASTASPFDGTQSTHWRPLVFSLLTPVTIPPPIRTSAKEKRELQLLAYFGALGKDVDYSLTNYIYKVQFRHLRICFMASEVPPSQALYALNAAIVGLGISDLPVNAMSSLATDNNLPTFILNAPPICRCVGLGLIHTIDTTARCFYIRTPVPMQQIQCVNTLLKGRIETPPFLFFMNTTVNTPYLSADSVGEGSLQRRARSFLPRRRFHSK
jgi:polynucleotide 5'-hydroxyl-kinase GRC3/NOL9